MTLDPTAADKLAKICGLFGSDHEGERASAALVADRIVKASGLAWLDFFEAHREPDSLPGLVKWLLLHSDILNPWELRFLRGVGSSLTPRQRDALNHITRKVRARTGAQV